MEKELQKKAKLSDAHVAQYLIDKLEDLGIDAEEVVAIMNAKLQIYYGD